MPPRPSRAASLCSRLARAGSYSNNIKIVKAADRFFASRKKSRPDKPAGAANTFSS
jgi:hypothetical protein